MGQALELTLRGWIGAGTDASRMDRRWRALTLVPEVTAHGSGFPQQDDPVEDAKGWQGRVAG